MEKVPEAGYRIIGLPVEGFRRSFSLGNIKVLLRLLISLSRARKIIQEFRPAVVVGFGGYASGPVLRSAARKGIPTLIQEQNSYAGLTNRLLAKHAQKICVAYEGMERYFPPEKIILAGNPVRIAIRDMYTGSSRELARKEFGLDGSSKVILVIGGSLGAESINNAVMNGLDLLVKSDVKMIWQCGQIYYDMVKASIAHLPPGKVILQHFIERMDLAYLAADLIVARAGAITISELCCVGKPALLVPSPNVAEDHQTKNAKALVEREAALYIPDNEAGFRLVSNALELLQDRKRQAELAEKIKSLAIPDSSARIAKEIISLMS
jgi:UDP-N-acetylglucosamine--N-acetylmuramyl-(pentapeptide) pyrophosphoryl-undecaprenol N-acetylglucosamine transferase